MAYNINGNIPCGTDTCTGSEHRPASACNSVYDIILNAIKEIKGDVANLDGLAKEATLLAKVAELKEALNSIDFTAIEQAIQGVEDVTSKEATLIQGVGDIIKAVENIDFTDLENSIAEVKDAVANIDLSAIAKEATLTQGISSVESKVEEVGNKIDNIKLPEIDTTELAKESTLLMESQRIQDEVRNIDLSSIEEAINNIDLSSIAKQGDNQEATNSKILEEVQNKLTPIDAVLTELNHGKQEMVDALATKNVQSSTDKTLSAIAGDIRSIAQSPITVDGGEMYEKQLFGAATDKTNAYEQPDAPMWNLYQVMANLLSDGRFVTYGGILLAEYGVDSGTIELNMAGAGGAYLTSDGAMYEVDTTHTWDRKKDGKLNRWVAYVFKEEWKDVSLTHSNILSIHIGGKVGKITCTSNTLISEIVVTDGNVLKSFNSNGYSHRLVGNITIKNIDEQSGVLIYAIGNSEKVFVQNLYIKANKIVSPLISATNSNYMPSIYSIRIECEELNSGIYDELQRYNNALKELYIKARKINTNFVTYINNPVLFSPDFIIIEGTEECTITGNNYNGTYNSTTLKYMYIGYDTNDKSKSVTLNSQRLLYLEDIELQDGWCKPFAVLPINNKLPSLTEENMINHILKRLKQDEEMCGSGVTITLGATNLAKLTSEEAVALLDSLTNTYGYTFA